MTKDEWNERLTYWAHMDARLHKLPFALIPPIAEHLAELEAAQQSVQRTAGPFCLCPADCPIHGEVVEGE